MKVKKLVLIFTRDFNQWTNQMVRDMYVRNFPKIWGRGLIDQMVHYTGRSFEWIRYQDDYQSLADYMVHKSLGVPIFQNESFKQFNKEVYKFRRLISIKPALITKPSEYLNKIKQSFLRMYPYYGLCVFVPGAWRESLLKIHGLKAQGLINRIMKSRRLSEGLLKENDLFMRAWFGPMLAGRAYLANYVKLLSVKEIETFLSTGKLPTKKILAARAKGFVYIGGVIYPTSSYQQFFKKRNLIVDEPSVNYKGGTIKGTVASAGGIIKGRAQTILNQSEVKNFKKGSILFTPMTSPEFLPAMKLAAAIVTDEGGLSCHAAIIARELGKPCVISTKFASKVIKDGDAVEVDANKGIVRKL